MTIEKKAPHTSHYRRKVEQRRVAQQRKTLDKLGEEDFFDAAITIAKDEHTVAVKLINKVVVNGHDLSTSRKRVGAIQRGKNVGWALSTTIKRATSALFAKKGVCFDSKIKIRTYHANTEPIMVTYDSGADGNCVSKDVRLKAGMPILQKSTKRVGVADAGTCRGK